MLLTQSGVRFICRKEAMVHAAYPDDPGYSIGFGHHGAKVNDVISLDDAKSLVLRDLEDRATIVRHWLTGPYKPNELDALTSAYANAGTKVLAVCYLINNGLVDEALVLLRKFSYKGGEKNQGLARRREQEINIYLNNDYGDINAFREYDVSGGPFQLTEFADWPP